MWTLYDSLIAPIPDDLYIDECFQNHIWTLVNVSGYTGGTISNLLNTRPPLTDHSDYSNMTWKQCAALVKSWNFAEASFGAAALNAYYNRPALIGGCQTRHPEWKVFSDPNPFTSLPDLAAGKKAACIGHFRDIEKHLITAGRSWILERDPTAGDYPDSACEYILPEMDVVIITGFTLINKTLPRLLELCQNAHVILVGPSVCMAPILLTMGVDELAGTSLPDFRTARDLSLTEEHRTLMYAGTPLHIGSGKNCSKEECL